MTEQRIASLCLGKPNVAAILSAAADGPVNFEKEREVLARFGNANWTDGTWKWRLGILNSWLAASGQAKASRVGVRLQP
ncbi:hypothetical protein [Streptomyces sp. UG1]|uniref:hypothetical protein n=1 Tax=Streptomyces sp. UG1 TaxID=3417652 RepID=UPI003CF3E51D